MIISRLTKATRQRPIRLSLCVPENFHSIDALTEATLRRHALNQQTGLPRRGLSTCREICICSQPNANLSLEGVLRNGKNRALAMAICMPGTATHGLCHPKLTCIKGMLCICSKPSSVLPLSPQRFRAGRARVVGSAHAGSARVPYLVRIEIRSRH